MGESISLFVAGNTAKIKESIKLIAAKGKIQVQAQSDEIEVTAEKQIIITSAQAAQLWAGKKNITLTSGGACIKIENGGIQIHAPGKVTFKAANHNWSGPAEMNVPMPAFPRSAIEDKPINFDFRLTDTPGPNGLALPYLPWRFVIAPNAQDALIATETILAGESDESGKVLLAKADQELLQQTYNKNPNTLWMVYAGQAREIAVTPSKPYWDKYDTLFHAMEAMGYSDTLQMVGEQGFDASAFHSMLGKKEAGTTSAKTILKKLKGADS